MRNPDSLSENEFERRETLGRATVKAPFLSHRMVNVTSQQADRRTNMSRMRRAAIYSLGAGGVLGIAAAFGPIWVVRAGIALALIAGVLASRFAWRETREQRIQHGQESLQQVRAHGRQLSAERQRLLHILFRRRFCGGNRLWRGRSSARGLRWRRHPVR